MGVDSATQQRETEGLWECRQERVRNKNINFNDRFVNNFPQKSEHALQVYKAKERKKITCNKISHQNGG